MSDDGKRPSLVPQIENGVITTALLSLPPSPLNLLLLLLLLSSLLPHSPPTNMCEMMTRDDDDDDDAEVAPSLL
jgi:hypothetical protein